MLKILLKLSIMEMAICFEICKTLPERERQWVLLDDGFETVFDQNGEPVYKIKECIDTFTYSYKDDYGNVITRNIKEKEQLPITSVSRRRN